MRQIGRDDLRERCFSQPAAAEDMPDAPRAELAGGLDFWDHLAATRAQEYAQEEILSDVILPDPPAMPLPAQGPDSARLSLGDMSAVHGFSLAQSLDVPPRADLSDDVLQEPPLQALPEHASLLTSASSMALDAAHLEAAAPFVAQVPPARRRRSRGSQGRANGRRTGRLAYRLQRIWLTPAYRIGVKLGTPLIALAVAVTFFLLDDARRAAITVQWDAVYDAIIDRPEFMVTELQLPPMSPELKHTLDQKLEIDLPQSSFRLDLDELRAEIEALDWVRSADLRLLSGGVLALSVTERVPSILWRSAVGLELLDGEGVRVAYVSQRALRPELPLIAGTGADRHVPEALELLDAAAPLGDRLRGLVRMGERRWDVVLDRNQRIRLPETGAVAALERVIALHRAQDLLARDLLVADLRNPGRPILQIGEGALDTLLDIRSQSMEAMQ